MADKYINKVVFGNSTLLDLTSDTVTAGSMLSGYTAHNAAGSVVTGTIPSKSSSDLTVSGATVTAPAGYYSSAASKSVATASPAFKGGELSLYTSTATAAGSNVQIVDTDTDPGSGLLLTVGGSATPKRESVLYNGAVEGYVSVPADTTALAAAQGSATAITSNRYYITEATLATNKSFTLNMQSNATLLLVDSVNNKTWVIKTDSDNGALTIIQQ